jgi:putative lipase involved disintegration of autophagic bodies
MFVCVCYPCAVVCSEKGVLNDVSVEPLLPGMSPFVSINARDKPEGIGLTICGHSLGGGAAALLALMLKVAFIVSQQQAIPFCLL